MGTDTNGIDMYEDICKKEFKSLRDEQKELRKEQGKMHKLLERIFTRLFVSNGDRALTEELRDVKMEIERHKEEHGKGTVGTDSIPESTKLEYGKFKLSTSHFEVARDLVRFLMVASIVAVLWFGPKLLVSLEDRILSRIEKSIEKSIEEKIHE